MTLWASRKGNRGVHCAGKEEPKLGCTWRVLVTWHCQPARIDSHGARRGVERATIVVSKTGPMAQAVIAAIRRIQAPEHFLLYSRRERLHLMALGIPLGCHRPSEPDVQLQQARPALQDTVQPLLYTVCEHCAIWRSLVLSYPTTPPPLQPAWLRVVHFWRQRVQMTPRVFSLTPLVGPGCPNGIQAMPARYRPPGARKGERMAALACFV